MVGAGRFELPTPGPPERDASFFWYFLRPGCPPLSLIYPASEVAPAKNWAPVGCNFAIAAMVSTNGGRAPPAAVFFCYVPKLRTYKSPLPTKLPANGPGGRADELSGANLTRPPSTFICFP
jgi:hypothetical protein